MDRLKYFYFEFNMKGRRGENDVTALDRWAVREHFVSGTYLRMYLSDCLQILHTTPLVGLVVPFGVHKPGLFCHPRGYFATPFDN